MIINKKTDTCSCCGNYCEENFGIDNYDLKQLDLDNYFKYKDIYVYKCPKCGMISTDISKEDKTLYENVKNTDKFKSIMDYEYLEGLDLEIFENESRSVPANLYDAYALMYENSSDKETYLRSLHKSIELKEIILEKYEDDLEDEEDEETFDALESLMLKNIENARKTFINEFLKFDNKNEFLFIMFIENLVGLQEYEAAEENIDWLVENSKLSPKLANYVEELTNEE